MNVIITLLLHMQFKKCIIGYKFILVAFHWGHDVKHQGDKKKKCLLFKVKKNEVFAFNVLSSWHNKYAERDENLLEENN